jgi:hypothetical protein
VGQRYGQSGTKVRAKWDKGTGKVGQRYVLCGFFLLAKDILPLGERHFALGRKIFYQLAQDLSPQGEKSANYL